MAFHRNHFFYHLRTDMHYFEREGSGFSLHSPHIGIQNIPPMEWFLQNSWLRSFNCNLTYSWLRTRHGFRSIPRTLNSKKKKKKLWIFNSAQQKSIIRHATRILETTLFLMNGFNFLLDERELDLFVYFVD